MADMAQLVALHHQLRELLPELIQVESFLEASLALDEHSTVSPLLRQRIHQCRAAIALLQAQPQGEEAMHLMRAKPFIEDSVATLREHQVRTRYALCKDTACPTPENLVPCSRAFLRC